MYKGKDKLSKRELERRLKKLDAQTAELLFWYRYALCGLKLAGTSDPIFNALPPQELERIHNLIDSGEYEKSKKAIAHRLEQEAKDDAKN